MFTTNLQKRNQIFYNYKRIVGVLAILCFYISISAQNINKSYSFKHYTIKDGLSQMQVMSLFQDSNGYLWCSTKAGLSRFDGANFKTIRKGVYQLSTNDLSKFAESPQNELLIFSRLGISKLVDDSLQYNSFPKGLIHVSYAERSEIVSFIEVLKKEQGQIKFKILDFSRPDSLKLIDYDNSLGRIVYFDGMNPDIIWQTRKDSVFVYDIKRCVMTDSYSSDCNLSKVIRLGDDVFGFSDNLNIYKLKGNNFELVCKTGMSGRFFDVKATPDNKGFILKTDKDLFLYNGQLISIKRNLTSIRDIYFDKDQNLWVATEEGLYNFFQLNFVNYQFGMGNKDWVWSVIEDEYKNMWFASYQNGLWSCGVENKNYSSRLNAKIENHFKGNKTPLQYRFYMGASKSNGNLYFPTEFNVLKYDGRDFTPVPNIPNAPYQITKTLSDESILCGGPLGLFHLRDNKVLNSWCREELQVASVLNVEKRKDGDLVVIGKDGVAVIGDNSIKKVNSPHGKNSYSTAIDHRNNVWIAGIKNVNVLINDSLINVASIEDEAFYSLLFVSPNHLLLGGLKGLYLANLNCFYLNKPFELIKFDENNGFTGIESGQNGFFTDSEGMVWLPTSDLVTRFDAQKLIKKIITPPKLKLNVSYSIDNILWDVIDLREKNKLSFDENSVRFNVHAISFSNIGDLRYYYQLEGVQNEWSKATAKNEITFYDLRPGHYSLKVKADPGIVNAMSETIIVPFQIEKPFWQFWWFYLIEAFLGISILVLIIEIFRKNEVKKAATQHRLDQLRSEALAAQLDPHFVMNCLNNISGLVNAGFKNEATKYIVKFSDLLRLILQSIRKDSIRLSAELDLVRKYMDLELFRCKNCFKYQIILPQNHSVDKIKVPAMILQPIVENSIKHGFRNNNSNAEIIVEIKVKEKILHFSVKDNGDGIDENVKTNGAGIATKITQERIALLQKKDNISFNVNSSKNGVEVIFELPLVLKH